MNGVISGFTRNTAGMRTVVTDASFSYMDADNIRSMSVKEINKPTAFTSGPIQELVSGGLMDPALGPVKRDGEVNAVCQTCGLGQDCPGHVGHIELACPVYHPLMFTDLIKVMKLCCMKCFRLKMSKAQVEIYLQRFALLKRGLYEESQILGGHTASPKVWEKDCEAGSHEWRITDVSNESEEVVQWETDAKKQLALGATLSKKFTSKNDKQRKAVLAKIDSTEPLDRQESMSITFLEEWHELKAELNASIPTAKCENCGSKSIALNKEGHSKVFEKPHGEPQQYVAPDALRDRLRKIFETEHAILSEWFPGCEKLRENLFFLDVIVVTPNKFRPLQRNMISGGDSPHVQTNIYEKIVSKNLELVEAGSRVPVPTKEGERQRPEGQVGTKIVELQDAVNALMDSEKAPKVNGAKANDGIRQKLEKKEGLFRQNMMGKRVNYAARSVISPDPNLATNEIGIPLQTAMTLSFPEPVTKHNIERLRQAVKNGPDQYPGANAIVENGKLTLLRSDNPASWEAESKRLAAEFGENPDEPPKVVYRHYDNGDPLLVNRQPTLHKPGIMAHRAKVLAREKTIRMHYANCNTYNADFDGDEMNLHAPQDYLSRAEAFQIADADQQYLVPTSGSPLRGIIQDHVAAGTYLTSRNTFMTKEQVCNLVYTGLQAIVDKPVPRNAHSRDIADRTVSSDICVMVQQFQIEMVPPALIKPQKLWTGKQVISIVLKTLVKFAQRNEKRPDIGVDCSFKTKTPGDIWGGAMDGDKEEAMVVIRDNELLQGVIDKSSMGATAFGMVHSYHEHLGATVAGQILTVLARMLTVYLQMHGFTCAMRDFYITAESNKKRSDLIKETREKAWVTMAEWLKDNGVKMNKSEPKEKAFAKAIQQVLDEDAGELLKLEGKIIPAMSKSWGTTIDTCIPGGQLVPFPYNCFAMMVQSGAKGSKINHSQIACLMGQQELEGHRVPLLSTMRTLPSFAPYDLSARAGGYVMDRFLTGIRPQEYFFHCMAGREGLVDTAVKTARSGYLQRCLVKNLESLKVTYDGTVRDSDNSIVEFIYGEDGIDVTKSPFVAKLDLLSENKEALSRNMEFFNGDRMNRHIAKKYSDTAKRYSEVYNIAKQGEEDKKAIKKRAKGVFNMIVELEEDLNKVLAKRERKFMAVEMERYRTSVCQMHKNIDSAVDCMDPITSLLSSQRFLGCTSEKHIAELDQFFKENPNLDAETRELLELKFFSTLAHCGEAVGTIAAQSMGEPSTQMTLNTFHLAGHGGANVTLGIPRLREIVQTATKNIATPTMSLPVLGDLEKAKFLSKKLSQVPLRELLQGVNIREATKHKDGFNVRNYYVTCTFVPVPQILEHFPHLSIKKIERFMIEKFRPDLNKAIDKALKLSDKINATQGENIFKAGRARRDEDGKEAAADTLEDGKAQDDEETVAPMSKEDRDKKRRGDVDVESGDEDLSEADDSEAEEINESDIEDGCDRVGEDNNDEDPELHNSGILEGNQFKFNIKMPCKQQVMLLDTMQMVIDKVLIHQVQGIKKAHIHNDDAQPRLETEGLNFETIWLLGDDQVDHDKIYSNDTHALLATYGVEAARQSIVNNIVQVFGAYGIKVDYRHLYLIADRMTHRGRYRPFNRTGMRDEPSPLLQMSFEATCTSLNSACTRRLTDNLKSPSGSIVFGGIPHLGTGAFSIMHNMKIGQGQQKQSSQKKFDWTF